VPDSPSTPPSTGTFESLDPGRGTVIGTFPVHDAEEVSAAVDRARIAQSWWWGLSWKDRRARLLAWRADIRHHMDELADLVHRETGKPRWDAESVDVIATLIHLDWAAKHAEKVLRPTRVPPGILAHLRAEISYEPHGVVGVIGPWNYPLFTPMGSISYALAAGNAVVFKPSEFTPATGVWLAESFARVVPEQPVLQTVTGFGPTGQALVESSVDKVSFTGSTKVARAIGAICGERLIPYSPEAGGKDAVIVDADADLDRAVRGALWGALMNSGQSCAGVERVFVHRDVYEEFLDRLVAAARDIRAGTTEDARYGPITRPAQYDLVRRHYDEAVAHGARVRFGGEASFHRPYIDPVILTDAPDDSVIMEEETFGPLLVVQQVRDRDEAIDESNAHDYGLGAAVYSRRHGMDIARRLRTGMVSVNAVLVQGAVPTLPWGGMGHSGYGRIHGKEGLRSFGRSKSIVNPLFGLPAAADIYSFQASETVRQAFRVVSKVLYG
jgi:succinate-semialdehyde dehydrogenase / glutarate-semialdehyde dehydrogenase